MRKSKKISQVMVILLLSSSLVFAQSFQREKAEKVYTDKSSNSSKTVIPPSDVMFDLEFQFPPSGIGQAGIETDGIYIYTTQWNGSEFYRYRLDGTFVETFTVAGVGWIRDLAYDGTYFYGSNATTAFAEMDFTPHNEALISITTAPVAVRAMAYDEDLDLFYANNWSSNISCFDRSGVEQYNFPVGPLGASYYGLAYDNYCGGSNPYLWGYAQVGATFNELIQINLPSGVETGLTFDVGTLLSVSDTAIAGGLCIADNIVPGEWTLIGYCQLDSLWGVELCVPAPAVVANDMACAFIDAPSSGLLLGTAEPVTITVFNKGSVAQSNIPVSYVFDGGSPVLETVPGPIPQNGYASYTFTATIDCSIAGSHTLMACTNLPSDADVSNDCLSKAFINIPSGDCQHQIDLYDDYGDGWNGGMLDVLVNGSIVLDDITLLSGVGPATFYFYVNTGDVVTTQYTTGGWPEENWYEIFTDFGTFITTDGVGGVVPAGITYDAVCEGCCDHQICLTDDYGDGWNGGSVDVYVNDSPVLTGITLADGYGPECFNFSACTGADIDVFYTAGGWPYENYYVVNDGGGGMLGESGTGGAAPTDLLDLVGNCPPPPPPTYCTYELCLTDDYGDGWNGGELDVYINGVVYLENLTLPNGSGPECHLLPVNSGDIISFEYTPGGWAYENEYYVNNATGIEIAREGTGGIEPGNMTDITAECTCCEHSVVLTDDYGDGWNGGTLDIIVNGTVVLDDIYCSGSGPNYFYFDACAGDDIDADYTPGDWAYEDAYQVFDGFGNLLGESGQGGIEPVDVLDMAGKCGDCEVDAGDCVTVYYGYEPAECTDLTATISNVTPPYTILWSTGETTETITVCPIEITTYEVTVTDLNGCVATDDVIVDVIDVRCGKKLHKVEICHIPPGQIGVFGEPLKSKTLCIGAEDVEDHLAHGDYLGSCDIEPCDGFYMASSNLKSKQLNITPVVYKDEWNIYPNPAYDKAYLELSKLYGQEIQVTIYDLTGKVVWNHPSQILGSSVIEVNLEGMQSGIYQVAVRNNNQMMLKKLVITR